MNDLVERMYKPSTIAPPSTLEEALKEAQVYCASDLIPKEFRGRPENTMIALQFGRSIGFEPAQALQSIYVVNGKPGLYGDGFWAIIKGHPQCEWTRETFDEQSMTATCTIKRRGNDPVVYKFSKANAEKAGLWNKDGPWRLHPERMLRMRARSFAGRDAFPDALRGLSMVEEMSDIQPRDMGMAEVVTDDEPQPAVTMPEAKPQPETLDSETGEVQRKPAPISPTALQTLTKMLADRQLTEKFCQHFGIADPKELPMSMVNPAMRWVSENSKQD